VFKTLEHCNGIRLEMNTQWGEAAHYRHRRAKPLPQAIADQLRRRIVSGKLAFDQPLPPLRKLARLYGVSLPTIHAAVHAVAALGLVRVEHGNGVYVSRPTSNAAMLNHACQNASTRELALIRASIDERAPMAVALAVQNARPHALPRRVRDLAFLAAERKISRHGYANRFVEADLAFHAAIAASLDDAELMVSLYRRVGDRLMPALVGTSNDCATDEDLHRLHGALAVAILEGRPHVAARLGRAISRRELESLD
jgi:DNA-binding FadR family transcriptional regulator